MAGLVGLAWLLLTVIGAFCALQDGVLPLSVALFCYLFGRVGLALEDAVREMRK